MDIFASGPDKIEKVVKGYWTMAQLNDTKSSEHNYLLSYMLETSSETVLLMQSKFSIGLWYRSLLNNSN